MVCKRVQIKMGVFKKLFIVILTCTALTSCVTQKKLKLMTDLSADTTSVSVIDSSYSYRLKPGDVLYLKVVSSTDSKMELFNQSLSNTQSGVNSGGGQSNLLTGNLIDQYGDIELPMVGLIRISGLTLKQTEKLIKDKMSEYLTYVTVTVKLMSFRVSVLGEVMNPGIKQIDRNHLTLLDALSYSGDLTDMANRKKVRLIRKENNRNKVYTIDMSSVNMLASEFYYLRPDDVIYVEPLKYKVVKVNSPTITLAVSAFSITLAIFAILSR
ncbi:MAG: polysaccharide transporter [Chitinophagaceae bacterium]|nr:polysaccharide transporter [Chitinophagaceae bacterium]